jgi:hypothetical protein
MRQATGDPASVSGSVQTLHLMMALKLAVK